MLNYFTATQNPRNIMTDQQVLIQLQQLPDNLKQEVSDFIGYLLAKYKKVAATPQPPEQKRFSKYRGSLKSGLSVEELDETLRMIRMGCDMSSFGDAGEYQTEVRKERSLPYRD